MTYCVGFCLDQGLVFASDSRTNAGVDYVTSYSKMHVFTPAPDRLFVLLSAGNLGTTQEVVNLLRRDLNASDAPHSLNTVNYLFEAADYLGEVSRRVQDQHADALRQSGVSGEVTLILGGQIRGQDHGLMLIYPQGNHIEATPSTPYLQIGENKYGKPVIDRLVDSRMGLEDAGRLALVSLSSTAKSNITVGPPFEMSIYRRDQFMLSTHCRFEENGGFLPGLEDTWRDGLARAFETLPRFDWEQPQGVLQGQGIQQQQQPLPQQAGLHEPPAPSPADTNPEQGQGFAQTQQSDSIPSY